MLNVPGLTRNQRWVLALAAQRVLELGWSKRNERRMAAQGGRLCKQDRYAEMVGFHALWLLWLLIAARRPVAPARRALGAVAVGQALRYWSIRTLGDRWSTRIMTVPDAALVRDGPYRIVRHPNYLAVAVEIAAAPLAVRAPTLAAIGSLANAAVLRRRIGTEEACLAGKHTGC